MEAAARPSLVVHVPHASRVVPAAERAGILLDDGALSAELLTMTDAWTDELFATAPRLARTVRFPVSRLVVDPERFLDDAEEPMAARGMGVVYTHTSAGTRLRDDPDPATRERLIDQYYRPHHDALRQAVDAGLEASGRCLVLDAHSFPSKPLPYEIDQDLERPDVCLGRDRFHTPARLWQDARAFLERLGLRVAIDRPFAGALVPASHHRRDGRVSALMVELNRGLYMDERIGAKGPGFTRVQGIVTALIEALASPRSG